jgi:peptidoglycan/xylan/chitin deacetylase (PgdA/CDA1 family)
MGCDLGTDEMKRVLVQALTSSWVLPLFSPLVRGCGTVFMFHRFADPEIGNAGHDIALLRKQLAALRRSRREVVTVDEIARRAREYGLGRSSPIAFTVDDGYADFASVAAPVFAEFDCPVTVFLVSGALDGDTWFWWDRITAAFEGSNHQEVELTIAGRRRSFAWSNDRERSHAAIALMEALKVVANAERLSILDSLPSKLDVDVPTSPPKRFAAMSWPDVRECARHGVTFGAHTVSHPILSSLDAAAARQEIATSWRRVRKETTAISKTFCYPNGRPQDITDREPVLLEELGFTSAVTTTPGYVHDIVPHVRGGREAFLLPRFAYPDAPPSFAQIISGMERVKLAVRDRR